MITIKNIILFLVIVIAVICIAAMIFSDYVVKIFSLWLPEELKFMWILVKFVFPSAILIILGLVGSILAKKRKKLLLVLWGILFFILIVFWILWISVPLVGYFPP